MDQKMNYKALAVSVVAAAIIFGYILMESSKLEEAAEAHRSPTAELPAPER
jgi:hypothetical protein